MSQPAPFSDQRPPDQAGFAQPTLLRAVSDHRTNLVDVPVAPLVAGRHILPLKKVRLDIESEHVIRLVPVPARPAWVSRLTWLLLVVCLCFMMYSGIQGLQLAMARQNKLGTVMWACFAGFPLLVLIGSLVAPLFRPGPLTYKFDKLTNLLTLERCVGVKKQAQLAATYSLDAAIALQLLYRHFKACQTGLHRPGQGGHYEMNLVFQDNRTPRINLAVHSDWEWMRKAGPRLAEFLDVTLVDQLCQG